ncbi:MAG: 4-hydroxy-3-methylbut-2-enyl diphosphate reductase [Planctomycetaceae bacterium]|nr:4-hydroxy-3-methylbut-2-enyl diphosphate reductase [Planctomycetaceae bacterium]
MRILLAKPRGFCAGVNMAVQALEEAVRSFDAPIFVYHEIVHNTWVVNRFAASGVRFVESLGKVPNGSVLMFSAHGVSPAVRREAERKQLRVIDATCPLVSRVHQAVIRYVSQGYHIIYVGHPAHDEVLGIVGEAPEHITVVSSEAEIDAFELNAWEHASEQPFDRKKTACLMQTTLSVDHATQMIEKLRHLFPEMIVPEKNCVCYATQNRQEAVRQLAPQTDIALVIGSPNSSNSRRLEEIATSRGITAHLIDGPDEIKMEWFSGFEMVLVTAGASAPEDVVEACLERLKRSFDVTVEEITVCEENLVFPLPKVQST